MPRKRIPAIQKKDKKRFSRKTKINTKAVKKMFKKAIIHKIAYKTGFVKRIRKLNVFDFFLAVTFGSLKDSSITSSAIIEGLSEKMTRASVNQRFNENTCQFFQGVYTHFLRIIITAKKNISVDLFNKFNEIKIIDSSSWRLPPALKDAFAGYKGAGCKIQLIMNYKSGIISLFDLTKETYNDQSYAKDISKEY